MTSLLIYNLKVAVLLTVFYTFYKLLVSRETYCRLNRMVLMSSILLSFVLPWCTLTFHRTEVLSPEDYAVMTSVDHHDMMVDDVLHHQTLFSCQEVDNDLFLMVYLIGLFLCLARTMISVARVRNLIGKGQLVERIGSCQVVVISENVMPFSWMRTIVLSKADYHVRNEVLLAHEKCHARALHSIDNLLIDMIAALQWFNPVIWFMRQEMRIVHEFEADAMVISQGFNIYQYLNLLILRAADNAGYSIVNGISTESTLSKRVTMMLRNKSSRLSRAKLVYVVLIIGVSLATTAKTVVDYQKIPLPASDREEEMGSVVEVPTMAPATTTMTSKTEGFNRNVAYRRGMQVISIGKKALQMEGAVDGDDKVFNVVEHNPQFPGGSDALMKYMADHIRYPKVAHENGVQGRVIVKFVVNKDGSLSDIRVVRPNVSQVNGRETVTVVAYKDNMTEEQKVDADRTNAAWQAMVEEAEKLIREMPNWIPGRQNGQTVSCYFTIPITFRLQ